MQKMEIDYLYLFQAERLEKMYQPKCHFKKVHAINTSRLTIIPNHRTDLDIECLPKASQCELVYLQGSCT